MRVKLHTCVLFVVWLVSCFVNVSAIYSGIGSSVGRRRFSLSGSSQGVNIAKGPLPLSPAKGNLGGRP